MKGEGGQAKVYTIRSRDRGKKHLGTYAESPFIRAFCYSFICKVLLSYFVVFGDDFHCCFIKHLL